MSLADLSEPVVVTKADGTQVPLRRLSPTDRMTFRMVFRTYRATVLKHFMQNVAGVDPVPALKELASAPLKDSDVDRWILEPEGQREALLVSLRIGKSEAEQKAMTTADVDALGLGDDEMFEAACGVMNLKRVEKPNPLPAAAPQTTTEIGSATPPTSPDSSESPATPSTSPATSLTAA